MSLYDFFKNLLGIPSYNNNKQENIPETRQDDGINYRQNFWGPNGDQYENSWRESHDGYPHSDSDTPFSNFNVFTDPLEMHRYFEQQINDVLKTFSGFFGQESGPGSFFGSDPGTFFGASNFDEEIPSLKFHDEPLNPNRNLRDQFLKPGYENRDNNFSTRSKTDADLDGKINSGDLDNLLKDKPSSNSVIPYEDHRSMIPQFRMFGQSVSSKTIRTPDGIIETHRTVRDSAGNEETTITKQLGDKQYTVKIRTDKDGKQETQENIINLDETELSKFKLNINKPIFPNADTSDYDSVFEKFFK